MVMSKKLINLSMFLIAILLLSGLNGVQAYGATPFKDVSGNWAIVQISFLTERGAITGYKNGTFKPDQPITRAEFLTIINHAFVYNTKTDISYDDVLPQDWFHDEVAKAVSAGYISGYPDNTMRPLNQISRQEAAAIMSRIMRLDTSHANFLPFTDASAIPLWSRNPIAAMVQKGLISGYPDGSFRPMSSLSRSEAAFIIAVALDPNLSSSTLNVRYFGAQGDGLTDDTEPLQSAVDLAYARGGGVVYVPEGNYIIDPTISLNMRSNTELRLASNAVLKAKATTSGQYAIVRVTDVNGVRITGGKYVGERQSHLGKTGEWGMGINIVGSNDVYISDIEVTDCWGDGIYIGSTERQNYCSNVVLEKFLLDNNRRQGISVISAKNLTIREGTISHTSGTNPQAGIDLEPNRNTEFMQNVIIKDVRTIENGGYGIDFSLSRLANTANSHSIKIINHVDSNSRLGSVSDYYRYTVPGYRCTIIIQ